MAPVSAQNKWNHNIVVELCVATEWKFIQHRSHLVCVTNSDFFHLCVQWSPSSIPYFFLRADERTKKKEKRSLRVRFSISSDCIWHQRACVCSVWQHDTTNAAAAVAIAITDSMGIDSRSECKMLNEMKYLQLCALQQLVYESVFVCQVRCTPLNTAECNGKTKKIKYIQYYNKAPDGCWSCRVVWATLARRNL